MYWWHIELNAVSLVNLVVVWQHKDIYIYIQRLFANNELHKKNKKLNSIKISTLHLQSVGISVEFCSHIIHSYLKSKKKTKIERASDTLNYTGSSVCRII